MPWRMCPSPGRKVAKRPFIWEAFIPAIPVCPAPTKTLLKGERAAQEKKNKADLRGSVLLFEARWGCLRTHSYKMRFSKEEKCTRDGERRGMMVHVLIECGDIHLGVCYCTSLQQALGIRTTLER